jgi:UDP:flavonoid glycosyltransferase YjiC (YdhE family)
VSAWSDRTRATVQLAPVPWVTECPHYRGVVVQGVEGCRVRVLLSFVGGTGHAEPMVPIAHALRDAGHTVAFVGHPRYLPALEARGFLSFEVDGQLATGRAGLASRPPALERRPLLEPNQFDEDRVLRRHYATEVPRRRVGRYLQLYGTWAPDLVIRDEVDFAAAVLTEELDIPHAVVLVLAAGSFIRPEVVAGLLDELRAERGLAPDPDLAALQTGLVLSPFPPSFRDPASPLPATVHSFRAPLRSSGAERDCMPSWWARLEGSPVVHVTLGTVFATESGDLFARLLTGLGQLPVEVVFTVGRDINPAEFGLQPEHVHVEQWVPQSLLLPHTDLVVSHGGSGTVIAALAHGLPQVVIAMGADQMHNADRVKALGVGRALHPVTTTAAEIRRHRRSPTRRRRGTVGGATYAARDLRTSRPRQCTHPAQNRGTTIIKARRRN